MRVLVAPAAAEDEGLLTTASCPLLEGIAWKTCFFWTEKCREILAVVDKAYTFKEKT